MALPPSAFLGVHGFPDAGEHLRKKVGIPPGVPVNLWAVSDPPNAARPPLALPMIAQLAIYGSEHKSLTLQEIYKAVAARFQFFKEQDRMGIESWRNSIRHALSLYSVFIKVPRPSQGACRGCNWVLNIAACVHGPYGRERKRRTRPKGSDEGKAQKKRTRVSKPKSTNRKTKRGDDSADGASTLDLGERNLDPTVLTTKIRARSGTSSRRHTRPSPLKVRFLTQSKTTS
ncbi:hypothetical protein B0H12DRAFT_1036985 [Mycena haematopus]|nr:hypothetical protein B0H12DRAFT_1040064 [Mycena haematopus]KAJ7199564.1 hypothetical protein B0H12DRAFT_1036985 [Mycena haematopus]